MQAKLNSMNPLDEPNQYNFQDLTAREKRGRLTSISMLRKTSVVLAGGTPCHSGLMPRVGLMPYRFLKSRVAELDLAENDAVPMESR
jgi:hypothetical protein